MIHSEHVEREELQGGRVRDTIHMKPIGYRVNGSLRRATNLLTASGDAAMPLGVDEIAQFRADPRIAGKSPLFHFGKGQSFARVALLGANNVSGTVNGNAIAFKNAWNNADLNLTYGGHFASFVAPLRTGHPRTFTIRLDSHAGFDPLTLRFGNDFYLSQPMLVKDGQLSIPLKWVVVQRGGKWELSVTLPAGDWAGWVLDPTLTLQPDGAAGKDTRIYVGTGTNYGINTLLIVALNSGQYTHKTLIEFDLSSIPSAAICVSATLYLYNNDQRGAGNVTVKVYSIAVGNEAWPEGVKNGAAGGVGDSSWNHLDEGANTHWAGSAGLATSGTDYEATAIGTMSYVGATPAGTENSVALNATRVQGWFGAINTNYGMLLAEVGTDSWVQPQFCSSDHATAAYRPKLVVEYTLPGGLLTAMQQYAYTGGLLP